MPPRGHARGPARHERPAIDEAALTPEQRAWWDNLKIYRDAEWGYVHLQRTKPMTAAIGLTDSPAGLASWILEKWWRWTDCADEYGVRDPYRRFGSMLHFIVSMP